MSSSIDIPAQSKRQSKAHSPMSSSSSTYSSSPTTPAKSSNSAQKQKMVHERSALSESKSTTINIGDEDGPPRLISYLSTSQGFEWNPELFLPSYIDYDYTPLENKREPVKEITLTDEEIQNMFPRN
ncbi:hypothetical protein SLS64_007101 [Diaporthe eres]